MSCRVLVIENDPDIGLLLAVSLWDGRVHNVQNLQQARDVLQADPRYEVIILDAMVGPDDGLSLAEERIGMPPPIIVLTANPMVRERAEAAGVFAFLTKPYDPDELRSLVQRASGRNHDDEPHPEQDEAEGG